jgi:hypothetical protein
MAHHPARLWAFGLSAILVAAAPSAASDEEKGGGNSRPGTLSFHQQHFPVREDRGPLTVAVKRYGGTTGAVTVHYEAKLATNGGAGAASATDFTPISGTLSWLDGDRGNKTFSVEIVDDAEREGVEVFTLELTDPTGGASIDRHNARARGQILDDDHGTGGDDGAGMLRFSELQYTAVESAGAATITVERQGGSTGAISVHYETADGSATAGEDYTATAGTLAWADGDEADKSFPLPVLDDSADERREFVRLRLDDATGGARIHPVKGRAVLEIVDNDGSNGSASGVIRFERRYAQVRESHGGLTVTVERTRGAEGAIRVAYAVRGGTASSPSDYLLTAGILEWADGDDDDKTFVLTVVDDTVAERKESIFLDLDSLTPGVEIHPGLGAMAVEIRDDD